MILVLFILKYPVVLYVLNDLNEMYLFVYLLKLRFDSTLIVKVSGPLGGLTN